MMQEKSVRLQDTNFVDCFQRSLAYVSTLTKPHCDIDRFSHLIDCLLDRVGDALNEMDLTLVKVIEDKSCAEDAGKKLSAIASEWKALQLDSVAFAHHQQSWATYNKYLTNLKQWRPWQDFERSLFLIFQFSL